MWSLPNTKETGSAESSLIVTCWIILSHVLHSANHASLKQLRPHQKPGATHKCEATSNESARLTPFSRRVVIWFGSGSSVFLRYPLGVYAATCRSWIGMKAKLGCSGMPHAYYPHGGMVLTLPPSEFNNRVWRFGAMASDQQHLPFVSRLSFSSSPL